MKQVQRIYIASLCPIALMLAIYDAGHVPVTPPAFGFFLRQADTPHILARLRSCNMVLRLPDESALADLAVDEAHRLGMPVYYTLEECLAALPNLS